MTQLIQQMLTLATLDRGDGLSYDTVDIVKLSPHAIRSFSSTFDRKIHFESNQDEVEVSVDSDKINQVIYILLDNARKYSDETIEFEVNAMEGRVSISITDYGEGIALADQEKLFERFYRVAIGRRRETGGLGRGVAIGNA